MLVEPSDLRNVFRNGCDEHLAAVAAIAFAAHQARLFQPIHHPGDGAGGQTGHLGEPSGGHPALQIKEIEAFQVGAGNPDAVRNGLPENHALRGRPPHCVLQFLHQRGARFRS